MKRASSRAEQLRAMLTPPETDKAERGPFVQYAASVKVRTGYIRPLVLPFVRKMYDEGATLSECVKAYTQVFKDW